MVALVANELGATKCCSKMEMDLFYLGKFDVTCYKDEFGVGSNYNL